MGLNALLSHLAGKGVKELTLMAVTTLTLRHIFMVRLNLFQKNISVTLSKFIIIILFGKYALQIIGFGKHNIFGVAPPQPTRLDR